MSAIAHILGSLAMQVVETRRDPNGLLPSLLAGAQAAERLAPFAAPESFTVVLSQLVHQAWWCSVKAGLPERKPGTVGPADLCSAIAAGDHQTARARARELARDEQQLWTALADCDAIRHVMPAAISLWALLERARDRVVAPDDAAAVAALLSDAR
jgi:hypothetical protein